MTKPLALSLLPLLAGIAVAGSVAPTAFDQVLKKNDHQKLGKSVAEYWEAVQDSKGISETLEELVEASEKAAKKAKKNLPTGDLLSAVEDWEEILYYAMPPDGKPKKGKVEERTYSDEYLGDYAMAISTPKKYSSKTGPYPVLICIPPKGESPATHLMEDWADTTAREEFIIVVCDMPTNERNWSEVGSPQNHGGIDTVLLSLRSVKSSHAVDVDRVFLAGFGEGAAAAAAIASVYPHVFAGVVGRAGDLGGTAPDNFRNLPTFFAGGGEKCTAFETGAKELGIENVTLEAGASEGDVWTWLRAQERTPNPAEVSLNSKVRWNSQAYWLRIEGFDPEEGAKIHARVDAESNTIHIDAEGVGTATVLYNDQIVDLSRPVKVVCNGEEHEDVIPRRMKYMLEAAWLSGDSGRVFVNEHRYDITAGSE